MSLMVYRCTACKTSWISNKDNYCPTCGYGIIIREEVKDFPDEYEDDDLDAVMD